MTRWGVVSTLRGSARDILGFAAHHLDLGADALYLFLDEENPQAFDALSSHPRIQVWTCDAAHWSWRKRQRPDKHQVRQTANASFMYRRTDLDWLAHIDIDEFLWPARPIADLLAAVPPDMPLARVRPVEAIDGDADLYKAFIPIGPDRDSIVQALYPTYGAFVLGGFLSHVQGKLFLRTGMTHVSFRIHNVFQDGEMLRHRYQLPETELCHRHAPDWDHWLRHYRFRLKQGSYQPGMAPNVPREIGGLNMHELLSWIEADQGEAGLREFYDELSAVDPRVRARLEDHGMILHRPLDLDRKLAKHFPGSC